MTTFTTPALVIRRADYSDYDRRVFGFVAERLLDVWLGGRQIKPLECRVTHLESQHWGKKILAFLRGELSEGS